MNPLRQLRRTPWVTAGAVVVLGAGLLAFGAGDSDPGVGVAYASVGDVVATAGAAGTVQSADVRDLAFGTAGTVAKVYAKVGDKVSAGKLLARLDGTDTREQLDAAEAALAASQDAYDKAGTSTCGTTSGSPSNGSSTTAAPVRYASPSPRPTTPTPKPTHITTPTPTPTHKPKPKPTHGHPKPKPTHGHSKGGGHPKGGGHAKPKGKGKSCGKVMTVAQAGARLTQAEVKVREAERAVKGTRITAAISGTVLSIGTTGSTVGASGTTGFVTLGDLDDLQVKALFSLADVNHLKIGQRATIGFAAHPGATYQGEVTRIDPAATSTGALAQYGVMLSLDEVPPELLVGMSATVQVTTAQAADTLYVPSSAIRTATNGTPMVVVRRNGGTSLRPVRLGIRGDRYVQIVAGLSRGDRVVTAADLGPNGFPAA